MSIVALSGALQDYLKAIYCLQEGTGGVSTTQLARTLHVSLPSVTSMMRKLAARRLVKYSPYAPVVLTSAGERQAREVVRHHRLLETYLAKALGFTLANVHGEADRLEHAMSAELEERIDVFLGRPAFDPHGSPIPDPTGHIAERDLVSLDSLGEGEEAVIGRMTTRDPEQLRYLESAGLLPGARLEVRTADRGSGVMVVALPSRPAAAVSRSVASHLLVSRQGSS
jgi:DtxR family transcriptional regulator, Mn-dependent transcriptional regulator